MQSILILSLESWHVGEGSPVADGERMRQGHSVLCSLQCFYTGGSIRVSIPLIPDVHPFWDTWRRIQGGSG